MTSPSQRTRGDLCPGVRRPWLAEDGALVRLRLIGGAVTGQELLALSRVARDFGDGNIHLTKRANLQVRGLPTRQDCSAGTALPTAVEHAIEATGLLPTRSHELVRNVLMSPLTGVYGGRADLRPLAFEIDSLLRDSPAAAGLSARFLFVLDDGRGDVIGRTADLSLVVLDADHGQIRVGSDEWTAVLRLSDAGPALLDLALDFVTARGTGSDAPWHVHELASPLLTDPVPADPRVPEPSPQPAYGVLAEGAAEHRPVDDGLLTPDAVDALVTELADRPRRLVVTPWRSLVLADNLRGQRVGGPRVP